jgi:hypothetical protein
MSDNEQSNDDWDGYYSARQRNDDFHGEYLRSYSARAYEYGVLSVKQLTLISGGGLLAIPATAAMAPELSRSVAANIGLCFVGALLFSMICTYLIHLNWSKHYDLRELYREKDNNRLISSYLPSLKEKGEDEDEFKANIAKGERFAWWTWILPHALGIIGFILFLLGCWFLYDGLNLVGAN